MTKDNPAPIFGTSQARPGRADSHPQTEWTDHDPRQLVIARPRSVRKFGLVLALAAAVMVAASVAGCARNTSSTGTTTAAAETTASPTSVTATSTAATAGANFVGGWHVHGSTMTITPTTAVRVASLGPCGAPGSQNVCSETNTMNVVSGDNTQLTLAVTGVAYTDQTGASVPNPIPGPSTAVGDTMQLTSQAPGLLKETALHGFPGLSGGNPYWCGAGISQADLQQCGA